MIKAREAIYNRFQDEIRFLIKENADIAWKDAKYCSPYSITAFVEALHLTLEYGIYREMVDLTLPGENPSFGVLVDLASTTRVREFAAVGIQYVGRNAAGDI